MVAQEDTIIDIYKSVIDGNLSRFPYGTWSGIIGENNFILCSRYLFNYILNWSEDDIKRNLSVQTFNDNHLASPFKCLCQSSPYKAINMIYPDRFKPYEIRSTQIHKLEVYSADRVRNLIDNILQWDFDTVCNNITRDTFMDNGLSAVLVNTYSSSIIKALQGAYGDIYQPWMIKSIVRVSNYWNDKTAKSALEWLLHKKLKWTYEDILTKFSSSTLLDNHLGRLVALGYDLYKVVQLLYPDKDLGILGKNTTTGEYNISELTLAVINNRIKKFPYKFISRDNPSNAYKVFKCYVEEYLKLSPTIGGLSCVTVGGLRKNRLRCLLVTLYGSESSLSLSRLIRDAYNLTDNDIKLMYS